jgi:hypothetical protein
VTEGPPTDTSFGEEVPIPDALEQRQPLGDEEPPTTADTSPPVESDPADWQEQAASAGADGDEDDYDRAEGPDSDDT